MSFSNNEADFSGVSGHESFKGEGWEVGFSWKKLSEVFDGLSERDKERVRLSLPLELFAPLSREEMEKYLFLENYTVTVEGAEQGIFNKEKTETISLWSLKGSLSDASFHADTNVVISSPATTLPKLLAYTHELGHEKFFDEASEEDKIKLINARHAYKSGNLLGAPEHEHFLDTILFDEHMAWENATTVVRPLFEKMGITDEQIEAHEFLKGRASYESRMHWVFGED